MWLMYNGARPDRDNEMKNTDRMEISKEDYIDGFIKYYGHNMGLGRFIELHEGLVLWSDTDEWKRWHSERELEYLKKKGDE